MSHSQYFYAERMFIWSKIEQTYHTLKSLLIQVFLTFYFSNRRRKPKAPFAQYRRCQPIKL